MNEFEILPNPTNWPQEGKLGVNLGYQRQNTNMYAIQTGIDTTEPFDNGTGQIIIPSGGIVEWNAIMYRVPPAGIRINKTNAERANWVAIGRNDKGIIEAEAVTMPGVWDSEKQGCYRADGRRTLNWVSRGTLAAHPPIENTAFSRNVKTTHMTISLRKGWYFVELGSGFGGGNGAGRNGGVPTSTKTFSFIFFGNKPFYQLSVGGSGDRGRDGAAGGSGGGSGNNGGGGGGGSGEETTFDGFSTRMVMPGSGNGGSILSNGQNGAQGTDNGGAGGTGGRAGMALGGGGGNGGRGGIGGGRGGDGGNGGDGGQSKPDGDPGGCCYIYLLGN